MSYIYFKLIHLFAVVIFLGNIITGLFWMRNAVKTKDANIMMFTMGGIIKSDRIFTVPGVIIITAAGIIAAIISKLPIFGTGWIFWSIILFSLSGIAFMLRVVPLQKKIFLLLKNEELQDEVTGANFKRMLGQWEFWGLVALISPLCAFVMMTLKIPQ